MRKYVLIAISVIFIFNYIYHYDRIQIDGLSNELSSIIFITDTKYSISYSHSLFRKIKVGMSEKEVLEILESPISKWQPREGEIVWTYSNSPNNTHFRYRRLLFKDEKVKTIHAGFYYD